MKKNKITSTQMDEIKQLCIPLVEYLRKNYHPYTTFIISDTSIKLEETILGIPLQHYD